MTKLFVIQFIFTALLDMYFRVHVNAFKKLRKFVILKVKNIFSFHITTFTILPFIKMVFFDTFPSPKVREPEDKSEDQCLLFTLQH